MRRRGRLDAPIAPHILPAKAVWGEPDLPDLAFHTLDQDVDLPGGACVKQRLKFKWYIMFGDPSDWDWTGHAGRWNEHYLE